jgi:parallel beta-helix repeat protein
MEEFIENVISWIKLLVFGERKLLKKMVSGIILMLLMISILTLPFNIQPVRTSPTTITVPDDYPTIQEAINHANTGDTVFVKSGVYHEEVVVNKTVSLIGQDKETTIINASGNDNGIIITSENVTIRGFTVENSASWGIHVKSSYCVVSGNNIISSQEEGLFLDGRVAHVYGNILANNSILNSYDCGIFVWTATNNYITFNTISGNFFGINLYGNATLNQIKQNDIVDNLDSGVVFDMGCSQNILSDNNITNNGWKALFCFVWRTAIVLNVYSRGNQIVENYVSSNRIGVWTYYYSDDNLICHNSFVKNRVQVYDYGPTDLCSNIWDNGYPSGGNYWSDYNGTDLYSGPYQNMTGSDGIGDASYIINEKNVDRYPLMNPWPLSLRITVQVYPDVLNLQHKADWVSVCIELSAYYNISSVDPSSLVLNGTIQVDTSAPIHYNYTVPSLTVEFNRTAVSEYILSEGIMHGNVTLAITGKLYDGTILHGSDVVRVRMPGDVNCDGRVDMIDIGIAAAAFGSYVGSPRWNPLADMNEDGKVNMLDIAMIAQNFGKRYS